MSLNLKQLAEALQLEYRGDAEIIVSGVASLRSARAGDLCFVQQEKYLDEAANSDCSVVIAIARLRPAPSCCGCCVQGTPRWHIAELHCIAADVPSCSGCRAVAMDVAMLHIVGVGQSIAVVHSVVGIVGRGLDVAFAYDFRDCWVSW